MGAMNITPVAIDSIPIGRPLPCDLVDGDGVLLAKKGLVVRARSELELLAARERGLCIRGVDADALQKAYLDHLQSLLLSDKPLSEIADSRMLLQPTARASAAPPEQLDWLDLQTRAHRMLRNPHPETFLAQLDGLQHSLEQEIQRHPDGALFALMQLASGETAMYSATHALLVAVMCGVAANEVLHWPRPAQTLLCQAALTMNIGMTDLQDRLSQQKRPPDALQRQHIDGHAAASVALLQALGVHDAVWLEAVAGHHVQRPGPLPSKTPAQRLARLIQRADMFAARMSPRLSRLPLAPAVAMQSCYFDENKQVDEAGGALIKAVGIFQPGAYVQLASDEVAVVVRRGANTSTPRVAVVLNRSGLPTTEHALRDTSQKEFRVVASVAHNEVKVQIPLERLLPLTHSPGTDSVW